VHQRGPVGGRASRVPRSGNLRASAEEPQGGEARQEDPCTDGRHRVQMQRIHHHQAADLCNSRSMSSSCCHARPTAQASGQPNKVCTKTQQLHRWKGRISETELASSSRRSVASSSAVLLDGDTLSTCSRPGGGSPVATGCDSWLSERFQSLEKNFPTPNPTILLFRSVPTIGSPPWKQVAPPCSTP
jgi:hypothetical protein